MPSSEFLEQIAKELLGPLYRGIPGEYRQRYSDTIWQQVEDHIRRAAYTPKLSVFMEKFASRLAVQMRSDDAATATDFLRQADARRVLSALRSEAVYLTLLVRAENEERNAAFKAKEQNRSATTPRSKEG